MRRPRLQVSVFLTALALGSSPASAQSTARPLPALSLESPISSVAASFPKPISLAPSAPAAAAPREGHAWTPARTEPEASTFSSLELFALAVGDHCLADASGSVAVQRGGLDATLGRADSDHAFALHLRNESSFYEWAGSTDLVAGTPKPFNDLFQTSVGAQLAVQADETWTWLAGLEVTMGGEDLVDPTDSLILGGLLGVRHAVADEVDFTFGLAGESRLEDDAWVVPFFGFDWQLGQRTSLAVQGSEIRFEHGFTDDLALSLGAGYDVRQYRLNGDGPVPGGVFRDESIHLSAGMDWQITDAGRLGVEVGQVWWSEYTVLDGAGALVGQSEGEHADYIGVSLTFGM